MILILAKLAGMKSVLAISEWAVDQKTMLRDRLGLRWKRMPCANTYWRSVKRAGGEAIVLVKDNTPATRADLALFFEDEHTDRSTWGSFEQVEKGHGRLERRWVQTSPDLNGWFARD